MRKIQADFKVYMTRFPLILLNDVQKQVLRKSGC
jgi:hypothetical protein